MEGVPLDLLVRALDAVHDGVVLINAEGGVKAWNAPLAGLAKTERVGESAILNAGPFRAAVADVLAAHIQSASVTYHLASDGPGDGKGAWISAKVYPIAGPGGRPECVVVAMEDITEQRATEDAHEAVTRRLFHAQQMEGLGNLAGGVAHDINNLLGAILGHAVLQDDRCGPGGDPKLKQALKTISQACVRGRDVVQSLLYFAHKGMGGGQVVEINQIVKELVDLLSHATFQRVSLIMDIDPEMGAVLGDSSAISNAFMNLAVNSIDAMDEVQDATLTMRTRGAEREGKAYGIVEFIDNGIGMSPEVLAKATEPYYTTKPIGKGTGLGLAMAFGTVTAHSGTMSIESKVGVGTKITMTFPSFESVHHPHPEEPDATHAPFPSVDGDALRVLVVDDDIMMIETLASMLEQGGYQAKTAMRGTRALEILDEGYDPHLVILDMNMPGMNGATTLSEILSRRAEQRVLISTGYSDEDVFEWIAMNPRLGFIQKPFTHKELAEHVARLLGT